MFYLFVLYLLTIASSYEFIDEQVKHDTRKIELMLPMRDGVNLHTLIFLPRAKDGQTKFPTVVDRR